MVNRFSQKTRERMNFLEDIDRKDRQDGTPRDQRLRQITPDTGKFLSLLLVNAPEGDIIEIGTSAAYSTLWLGTAAKEMNRKIKTFEISEQKVLLAKETIRIAELEDYVEIIPTDFFDYVSQLDKIAYCFLDAEKDLYERCFTSIADKIVFNGLIIADNAINHYEGIKPMIEKASNDIRFDCLTVPIGNGEFICRRNKN